MKTAMQEMFSQLEIDQPQLFNINTTEGKTFVNSYIKFIELEKEQLCYFYIKGAEAEINNPYVSNIEFYEKTFKK